MMLREDTASSHASSFIALPGHAYAMLRFIEGRVGVRARPWARAADYAALGLFDMTLCVPHGHVPQAASAAFALLTRGDFVSADILDADARDGAA